ncbi:MAG: LysM peptidoglycan-binding domain-containing protein [Candidatus Bathyarchaeota archaeon]|uniref:LysM peptidoglycan-binding domain-containing protein n=1 Tax=Candidatus Bathycorpusculum sp. TaxID=2994959 RepID=UPI00281C84A1|nr:LysM peptidoglycan-binding domain-containing protein [Candidatus Termiticorpusculum sp.]MCL2257972.1 LysM peptidoglycan-binding domain-containing protein [Candidatus Termiticorpusculum sp.]MCL2291841.1 LysM peptidoglycan-binding domain-containing protein [Candidatus Termiticorpusculum sp.]
MKKECVYVNIRKYVVGLLLFVLMFELVSVCAFIPLDSVYAADSAVTGSSGIDYNIWTLDLPTGKILSSGDLKKSLYNSWWYPGTDTFVGYDMFQTPQRGAGEKEFGSPHVRCELREIIPGSGDTSGSWGTNAQWGRLGYHKMVTEVKAERINNNGVGDYATQSYTCIGQLWGESGGKSAMFSLMYIDAKLGASSFRMRSPDTTGSITYSSVHIPVGKAFTVTYECINGRLQVWVESKEANVVKTKIYDAMLANPADSNSYYFKVGNYDQSSDSKGDPTPDPKDVHTLIGFKSVTVEHNPIRGRLTYADNSPVANQVINYVLNGGGTSNLKLSTKTDANGYYDIFNIPSNGGVTTASVSITVPTLSGYTSDKTGVINVNAASTATIIDVRVSNAYDIIYSSSNSQGTSLEPSSSPSSSLTKEPTPNATIDYVAETLQGLNGAYVINGKTISVSGGLYSIDSSWFGTTITIIKKGSDGTSDSATQRLFIKDRPSAPVPRKTDCTTSAQNNGVITKVTNNMEYSADNGVTWKTITGSNIQRLKPGTYYVRVKATNNTFKSNYATVVINEYSKTLPSSNYLIYTVRSGDTLWLLAQRFGTSVNSIKALNGLTSDMIYPRQTLRIQQNDNSDNGADNTFERSTLMTYTVRSGDTLWLIAQRFGTFVNSIKALNGLTSDMIYPRQTLQIQQNDNSTS